MSTPGQSKPGDAEPALPPYEGRKSEASTEQETEKDGARTGGATAPVTDPDMKAPDPADTERGATGSPSDEQPAQQTPDGEPGEASTGPSHEGGTGRGEEKSSS
ncbi:MAG: hypothetical protein ACR2F6_07505 [Mycobacteriales bacterium]